MKKLSAILIFAMIFQLGIWAVPGEVYAASGETYQTDRWEESNSSIQYIGKWETVSGVFSGGYAKYTKDRIGAVIFRFIGNGFGYHGSIIKNNQAVDVIVDKKYRKTVDTRTGIDPQLLFEVKDLPYGEHEVILIYRSKLTFFDYSSYSMTVNESVYASADSIYANGLIDTARLMNDLFHEMNHDSYLAEDAEEEIVIQSNNGNGKGNGNGNGKGNGNGNGNDNGNGNGNGNNNHSKLNQYVYGLDAIDIYTKVQSTPLTLAAVYSNQEVILSWNPSVNAQGYVVAKQNDHGDFERIARLPVSQASYIDDSYLSWTSFDDVSVGYRVGAVGPNGVTHWSEPVYITIPANASNLSLDTVYTNSQDVLTWKVTNPNSIPVTFKFVVLSSQTTFTHKVGANNETTIQTPLALGLTASIYVNDRLQDTKTFDPNQLKPPAPTQVAAVVEGMNVVLSWQAVDQESITYKVYRSVDGVNDELINGFVTTESFIDVITLADGVNVPTVFFYKVSAVSASGVESDLSAAVSVVVEPVEEVELYVIEENDTYINYTGSWLQTNSVAKYSGGTANYSYATNGSFEFSFIGTEIHWYGFKNQYGGIASVYVNGEWRGNVDTYSSEEQLKEKLYSIKLPYGKHTLRIERNTAINPNSLGANIPIDFLETDGKPIQKVNDDHPYIVYTGTFLDTADPNNSNNRAKYSYSYDASIIIPFKGTAIEWYGFTSSWNGIVDVYLDGEFIDSIDGFREQTNYHTKFLSLTDLSDSIHILKLVRSDKKNPLSNGVNINIDYLLIDGEISELMEHSNSTINYTHTWHNNENLKHLNGVATYSYARHTAFETTFYGTSIAWYGFTSEWNGIAKVYIDNALVATVDLYSAVNQYQQQLFFMEGLDHGIHKLKVVATDDRNAQSKGANLTLEYLITDGTFNAIIDETDPSINYNEPWLVFENNKLYNNKAYYTHSRSATAEISFEGTGVTIIGFTNAYGGKARYYLDGKYVGESDAYSETFSANVPLFEIKNLQKGNHTLTIRHVGSNPQSLGANLTLDAIVIFK